MTNVIAIQYQLLSSLLCCSYDWKTVQRNVRSVWMINCNKTNCIWKIFILNTFLKINMVNISEAATGGVLLNFKIQNSKKNTCVGVSFFNFSKKETPTQVSLLWILLKCLEHLFYRTPPDGCFWYLWYNENILWYDIKLKN